MKIVLTYVIVFVTLLSCKQKQEETSSKPGGKQFSFRTLTERERKDYRTQLQKIYDSLLFKRGFNGSLLIAKNGEILFEQYQGYENFSSKDTITPESSFHIASVSKTITAAAVLKLWEQHKINLEDSLQVYFPNLPYKGITIKMLLNHRSGLPNYLYFMKDDSTWNKQLISNNDVLRFMISDQPAIYNQPGRAFHYCNTNYVLLALLVEKITGQTFPDYVQKTIFQPMGMKNSYIFSIKDSLQYKQSYYGNNKVFKMETLDCVYGDKNVYSTPRDLLQWDLAMYNHSFLSKETYEAATQGYSFEKAGTHNYGLGWRLLLRPESKVVYHNGWWHGNNATFTRLVSDTATIIILGNKYNRNIYSGMKFAAVFDPTASEGKELE